MFVVVAVSLSGSSYRLSQTLSLFLYECLIMTHRLWQDIWITLEAARLQMEADPVRQSLSNIYQWSVEAIFHCSHLLFNSVPEVSSFMSSSKLLDVSSEYFTMMHCFKMIVSNCGKVVFNFPDFNWFSCQTNVSCQSVIFFGSSHFPKLMHFLYFNIWLSCRPT